MEDIIIMLLQFLAEFVFDILLNLPFDLLFDDRPGFSRNKLPAHDRAPEPKRRTIIGVCFLWWVGGCLMAEASLHVMHHTLIPLPALRILNLFLAPVVSACLAETLAVRRAGRNKRIVPRNHFWTAFWFTLGYVAVRFAYATRL